MNRSSRQSAGLTLIEITVVLILMSLLASTVALSSRGMLSGVTQQDIIAQIESLDSTARRHAKQTGQTVQFVLDDDLNRITLTTPEQPDQPPLATYNLPNGYRFEKPWRLLRGEAQPKQPLILHYDHHGTTHTWGVTLSSTQTHASEGSRGNSPGGDEHERLRKMQLFIPGGGQVTIWESDEAVQDILVQVLRRDTD